MLGAFYVATRENVTESAPNQPSALTLVLTWLSTPHEFILPSAFP